MSTSNSRLTPIVAVFYSVVHNTYTVRHTANSTLTAMLMEKFLSSSLPYGIVTNLPLLGTDSKMTVPSTFSFR